MDLGSQGLVHTQLQEGLQIFEGFTDFCRGVVGTLPNLDQPEVTLQHPTAAKEDTSEAASSRPLR